ncbi:MAG: signal peptidase I [Treponema sp.]
MNKNLYDISYSVRKDFQRKIGVSNSLALLIFLTIHITSSFLVFPVRLRSVSMLPDIPKDTCILFSPLVKSYERGDVVLVRPLDKHTGTRARRVLNTLVRFVTAQQFGALPERTNMGREPLVRRIIGVPGDTVYMRDYVTYIKPEDEKSFLTEFELIPKKYDIEVLPRPPMWDTSVGVKGTFENIVLGKDEYLVLGDNRNCAVDSRFWGAVGSKDLYASALIRYFPFNKIQFL